MLFLQKLKGQCQERAPRPNPKLLGFACIGALLAGSVLGFLAFSTGHAVIMGSFGASIFLVMAAPDVPFSQPRHIIGGHFVASAIGLFFFHLIGDMWWSMALALALATVVMLALRIPHPPAGSNPVAIFLTAPSWDFIWLPTLLGAVIVVIIALVYNNLRSGQIYPKYW